MLKKSELIRRELLSCFNDCIYNINRFKLNLVEEGNSSLGLKAEVSLPLM